MFSKEKITDLIKNLVTVSSVIWCIVIITELGGISWLKNSVAAKTAKIAASNDDIQTKTVLLEKHFLLKKETEQAKKLEENLKEYLASRDDLLQLATTDLATIAKDSNVDISTSFTGEVKNTETLLGRVGITLNVNGLMPDIIRFLREVEKSRFLIQFSTFDITPQGDTGRLQFSGRGEVIFRK